MHALTEAQIRASLINVTQSERRSLTLPNGVSDTPWDALQFYGARDRKLALVGYVVVELDGEPTGLLLRQADARPKSRAQCSWCNDIHLPNDVLLFTAKRVGDAGRRGDTVGTLACDRFQCNENVRRRPASAYIGFDVEAARATRIAALRENVEAFVRSVRDGR
ncbi:MULTISPECIES: FBP domain-containing protein [unclassified Microbacterium]|uniref:FBP domain-containing protein n=1 Tax=unclassified Microbacterium TaxID=2609290 RepID=UPI00086B1231|nr:MULTISPECIES: FBP domain-containing protein [unclassified Microbacterium]AXA97637.1 translation elongation factor [Microbacterium sp. PM5]ODT23035.1 MAG: translation elongation factor [Microbacterium sp. SCN 69-37]